MSISIRSAREAKQRSVRLAIMIAAGAVIIFFLRRTLLDVLTIIAGAAGIVFLLEPLANVYEKRFSRSLSALCALLTCIGALLLGGWYLLPRLLSEAVQLAESLPDSIALLRSWISSVSTWMDRYLPGLQLPSNLFDGKQVAKVAQRTLGLAGNIADFFYRISLMIVLAYFFLCDRARLLLRLELLVPCAVRTTVVMMGAAVMRELKLYLRGQGLIAALVGLLSAVGLAIVGVKSSIVLGIIIGILNMIPYFGPVIGAVPAVLTAIGSGWDTALLTIGVLWLVQQIDGMLISPRIMGSMSGVSPATVLLAIFIGSGLGGIIGMLLAMPAVMTYRTVFRVLVQKYENV